MPLAFEVASRSVQDVEREVRLGCRALFRKTKLLDRLIPLIDELLSAGELKLTDEPRGVVEAAIPVKEGLGDAGHRH
ncbi:MAG: hypothetical protein ACKO6N_06315 [Myxococcota bacterium]